MKHETESTAIFLLLHDTPGESDHLTIRPKS